MTAPHPEDARTSRSSDERRRARVKLARKWAYLVSADNYVPHSHAEVEQAMLELVHALFGAVAVDPADVAAAAAAGARLLELNCVGTASMVSTIEVLTTALLGDEDTRRLDRLPERVGRVLGGLVAGHAAAARRAVIAQQDGMCRTLMTIARNAIRDSEAREAQLGEVTTELSLLRAHLGHQLLHDALTGLANGQFFATRLEQALGSGRPVTLFRLELCGFAMVNDGLGRLTGETWLSAVAERLHRAAVGRVTLVARLDGVNFALLQESALSTADIAALVGQINDALAEPTYLNDVGLATTANVGVVQSPPHRAAAGVLLHAADLALRAATRAGPGQWALHGLGTDDAERRLLRLAAGVPGAWETGQLTIGYEPRVYLADGHPAGVQACLRWRDPTEPPHPGLSLAEQTGLTPQLGRWLLRGAGERLREGASDDLVLAVSLSPNQSSAPDLVDTVLNVFDDPHVCRTRLQIAMPATELCHGRAQAAENLALLAAAGVRTAVHDFGGGAAELIRLADLPAHEVWLGGHLVRQARRPDHPALVADTVAGLITLVHRTGATVGVSDVRDHTEAARWREAGADVATGPLFTPTGPTASLFS